MPVTATPEKKSDHLKRIERNVELADNVITSLSNFAKVPVPALVPIAIEPLLSEALEINPPGEGILVTVDCPAGLPRALGDGDQLRIALGNLIRNARDAMIQGGRLAISAVANDGVRGNRRGRYAASASRRRNWPGSWSLSTRRKREDSVSDLQLPGRSWKKTRVACP